MSIELILKRQRTLWGLAVFLIMICIDQLAKNSAVHAYKNYYFAFSLPLDVYVMYGIYFMGIAALSAYVFKQYQNLSAVDFRMGDDSGRRGVECCGKDSFRLCEGLIYIRNGVFNFADGYIILG